MQFWKYHGLGNDFILTEDPDLTIPASPERAIQLCNRHTGIGADGWMLIRPSQTCDIQMFLYNSDGSTAEMCGNGLRCFARHVYDRGLVRKSDFTVETLAGTMQVHVAPETGLVTANIGRPSFDRPSIPMVGTGDCRLETVTIDGKELTFSACLMGVPHVVVFGRDFTDADVLRWGPPMEIHPMFPRKANINFANLLDDGSVELRTWERGCGRTLACGTGSCAAAALCAREGFTGNNVHIRLQEGSLQIRVTEEGLIMTGPAALAFCGTTDLL